MSEDRKPAEREAEHCGAAHTLLDPEVATQMRKETGWHFVLAMLNNVQGTEGTYMQRHSHVPVPSPFLLPASHTSPPKENDLLFTF